MRTTEVLRGRHLIGCDDLIVAFVVDEREVPVKRYGGQDERGNTLWSIGDGTDPLVIAPTDRVEVVMDTARLERQLVGEAA